MNGAKFHLSRARPEVDRPHEWRAMPLHAERVNERDSDTHLDEGCRRFAGRGLHDGRGPFQGSRHVALNQTSRRCRARRDDDTLPRQVGKANRLALSSHFSWTIRQRKGGLFDDDALKVLGQLRKYAEAQIDFTLVERNQRLRRLVDTQAQCDVRVEVQEVAKLRRIVPGVVAADGDGEPALRRRTVETRQGLFGALENATDLAQELLARHGQHELVGHALEQIESYLVLQLADFGRYGRNGLSQPIRREPKGAELRDEMKGAQPLEVERIQLKHVRAHMSVLIWPEIDQRSLRIDADVLDDLAPVLRFFDDESLGFGGRRGSRCE